MDGRLQIVAVGLVFALLLVVLELVRRRRLLERYALLWLLSCGVLIIVAIWRGLLGKLADATGIVYAPNAIFLVALVFVLFLLLHFSVAVSRLTDQSKILAQRIASLEERLRMAERSRPEAEQEPVEAELDEAAGRTAGRFR